jgi:hypothetical protein
MKNNDFKIFRKYATICKTKERYIEVLLAMKVLPNVNEPMAKMTLRSLLGVLCRTLCNGKKHERCY